ncbi:MAG: hypothetical protein AABW89_06150 [Nanoarchaeota archaeon]
MGEDYIREYAKRCDSPDAGRMFRTLRDRLASRFDEGNIRTLVSQAFVYVTQNDISQTEGWANVDRILARCEDPEELAKGISNLYILSRIKLARERRDRGLAVRTNKGNHSSAQKCKMEQLERED